MIEMMLNIQQYCWQNITYHYHTTSMLKFKFNELIAAVLNLTDVDSWPPPPTSSDEEDELGKAVDSAGACSSVSDCTSESGDCTTVTP